MTTKTEPIRSLHDCDLIADTGTIRVWVSRMTIADGADLNRAVEVEHYDGETWRTISRVGQPEGVEA